MAKIPEEIPGLNHHDVLLHLPPQCFLNRLGGSYSTAACHLTWLFSRCVWRSTRAQDLFVSNDPAAVAEEIKWWAGDVSRRRQQTKYVKSQCSGMGEVVGSRCQVM
jgi:hypothetical protein